MICPLRDGGPGLPVGRLVSHSFSDASLWTHGNEYKTILQVPLDNLRTRYTNSDSIRRPNPSSLAGPHQGGPT